MEPVLNTAEDQLNQFIGADIPVAWQNLKTIRESEACGLMHALRHRGVVDHVTGFAYEPRDTFSLVRSLSKIATLNIRKYFVPSKLRR
jgi:hypothetical protein